MTPDFCKSCPTYVKKGGYCVHYHKCSRWRAWFRHHWALIQKAAKDMKKQGGAET